MIIPDSQILAELLEHEGKKQSQHQSTGGLKGSRDSEDSSSEASSDEGGMEISQAPSWQVCVFTVL